MPDNNSCDVPDNNCPAYRTIIPRDDWPARRPRIWPAPMEGPAHRPPHHTSYARRAIRARGAFGRGPSRPPPSHAAVRSTHVPSVVLACVLRMRRTLDTGRGLWYGPHAVSMPRARQARAFSQGKLALDTGGHSCYGPHGAFASLSWGEPRPFAAHGRTFPVGAYMGHGHGHGPWATSLGRRTPPLFFMEPFTNLSQAFQGFLVCPSRVFINIS